MKNNKQQNTPLNILLADDDSSDRFFFEIALKKVPIATNLTTAKDGEKLMEFLSQNSEHLPDVLFLDLNMPRKNGSECLKEIKADEKLKQLPVIIYSTSLLDTVADALYEQGAHYYLRKRDLDELEKILHYIFTLIVKNKFTRPERDKFILGLNESVEK